MKKNIELIKFLLLPIYMLGIYQLFVVLNVSDFVMTIIFVLSFGIYCFAQLYKITCTSGSLMDYFD